MDWLFHILFGLVFYNSSLNLTWFLVGNVVLDVFFIFSFLQVAGFRPRSLNSMRTFDEQAEQTFFHKIGWFGHGFPAMILYIALSFFVNIQIKSLLFGMILHQLVDLCTHKNEPKPLWLPFSSKKNEIGFMTSDARNMKIFVPSIIFTIILLVLKYGIFGFII